MRTGKIHIRAHCHISALVTRMAISILAYCHIGILASCTRADIQHRPQPTAEGYVQIHPTLPEQTLPPLSYYFYNTDGETAYIFSTCDGKGNFDGMLPIGNYRVIATNTNATGAEFRNMDSHETATVHATNLTATTRSTVPTRMESAALEKVYNIVLETLTVTARETIYHNPTPVPLTRTVTLNFTLDEMLSRKVTRLWGALPGVYPSVHLYTCCTTEEEMARSPDVQMEYVATQSNNHTWEITLQVFGLCNPNDVEGYRSIMPVFVQMNDEAETIAVDLTQEVSDVLAQYGGSLPASTPIVLTIALQWDGICVTASVKPWRQGGMSEIEE